MNLGGVTLKLELIMLGTGHAMVTKCYNTCFAIRNGEEYFLVDAGGGNGIMQQLEKAEIPYKNIRNMFVTHGHTDHVLGVVWVIRKVAALMNAGKYEGDFNIYCHDEVKEILHVFCRMTLTKKLLKTMDERIHIIEVKDDDKDEILGMKLNFFDIKSTKAKQFGFTAILPNGKKIVCLGDEPFNKENEKYMDECDLLLSEAYCLYEDREAFKPYEKHHSTALDAGVLAENLGAKALLLYHTEDSNLAERKRRYSEEAAVNFKGKVFVPEDLERIDLEMS